MCGIQFAHISCCYAGQTSGKFSGWNEQPLSEKYAYNLNTSVNRSIIVQSCFVTTADTRLEFSILPSHVTLINNLRIKDDLKMFKMPLKSPTTIPRWKDRFSSEHRSKATSGPVSTMTGDRMGIPGVVGFYFRQYFANYCLFYILL